MAPSRTYPDRLNFAVAVTVAVVFCLTFLSPSISAQGFGHEKLQRKKNMVLGSKPPGCVNKCFSCRPCMATLVIPSHKDNGFTTFKAAAKTLSHGEDDNSGYYLLSWKCRCGDKLFNP
ncbi:EPIDERMAL PATTERNING FACTOR-like protein 8 isoform X2 [Jatropha curcas]|uniref:EPIDERMAL PATTERNING FACTOR-like protein 8 isoform X2 n=1 Tax=Jatropha curcas TaxID=180498 RepID=UPI0009D652C0|nr:EPIDERMAL PATTERNING FACTOR-like protein 8 isoform X2 [Jatropha curcas]